SRKRFVCSRRWPTIGQDEFGRKSYRIEFALVAFGRRGSEPRSTLAAGRLRAADAAQRLGGMMEEPRIGAAGLESGTTGGVAGTVDVESLRHLFEVGRGVLSELDPEVLFDRVLETAREITGARYAALGVMDESRRELERFLVRGIDEDEQHAIGDPPRGLGVLGELIKSPSPLRLADVGQHPRSYGFPV